MTDERPPDSPYEPPKARLASAEAAGLPPIWPRFLGVWLATSIPSTALMLASMGSPEGSAAIRFPVVLLLWALPSWFILWPTFKAAGGWDRTDINTRIMVPGLFAIALGLSTFILSIVVNVAFSIYSRL